MTFVDADGRLFGRFNLLDVLVGIVVLALVPLAYGAWALFRTPVPQLEAVEPAALPFEPAMRVTIRGEHLRPYLRVSFGSHQGRTFVFNSTSEAEVDIQGLEPGVYDVILYDHAQERSRLPQAFTVAPSTVPSRRIVVVGTLANLTAEQAAALAGTFDPGPLGRVLRTGSPMPEALRIGAGRVAIEVPADEATRLPLALELECEVRTPEGQPRCVTGEIQVVRDAIVPLPTPYGLRPFQIDQILGPQPLERLTATVRLRGAPEVLALLAPGDVDAARALNPEAAGARLVSIRPGAPALGWREVDVHLDAQDTHEGWTYDGGVLRAGGPFTWRTPRYELAGEILRLVPDEQRVQDRP